MNAKFKEIINSNQLILVDFYADWCGPCKMMSPILQEVKGIIKDDVKIIKINVDQHQDLASHFMVRGVPTLMLFKSGKMLWRQSGVLSTKDLVAIIQNQLN
ncbi:thioredoxin [Flavobacterium sp. HXWNR29]|jgi:thioredoxin 1|uniref:thioredoxin n=1 Tax=Flavobacterium odoriferum TaxID=2946604 RepID=UPI0021CB049A|nr:thioredoxin [Flavobacterium sp. HXWNR29]MCU4190103.1 thioredoxin [Flavobacterium sp. HXWNR29]